MTLHQLALFVVAAETRKLSEASARFGISQPAVTRQLQALGREYGTQLYVTTRRGVALTPEGERFLQHARKVVEAMRQLEQEFHRVSDAPEAQLLIGACFSASHSMIPAVVSQFVKSFPNVKVDLVVDRTRALLPSVLDGGLDVAVVLHVPPERESVKFEAVSSYTLMLVGPADHWLTRKSKVTTRELKDVPLILHKNRPITENLLSTFASTGFTPRIGMECLNAEGIKTAIRSGLGFGLLLEEHISTELRAGLLRPVKLDLLRTIRMPCYAVYSAHKPVGRVLRSFIDLLHAYGKVGCPDSPAHRSKELPMPT